MTKVFESPDLVLRGNPNLHERIFKPDSLLMEDHRSEARSTECNQILLCIEIIYLFYVQIQKLANVGKQLAIYKNFTTDTCFFLLFYVFYSVKAVKAESNKHTCMHVESVCFE